MKAIISTVVLALLLAVLVATQSGCLLLAGAAAGATGFAYDQGDLTGYVDADVQRTAAATRLAMNDLQFPLLSSYATTEEGRIEGRIGTDNKAVVKLKRKSDRVTKVNIRIGTFGDESLSQKILEKVQLHLNDPALRPSATAP